MTTFVSGFFEEVTRILHYLPMFFTTFIFRVSTKALVYVFLRQFAFLFYLLVFILLEIIVNRWIKIKCSHKFLSTARSCVTQFFVLDHLIREDIFPSIRTSGIWVYKAVSPFWCILWLSQPGSTGRITSCSG